MGWARPTAPPEEAAEVQYAESVLDLIGGTPLVRLTSVTRELGPDAPLVLAKVEFTNPGGSVKDRLAVRTVDAADPRSYYSVSDRLSRESPGGWMPDQYSIPANPQSHYETTGPEIWAQPDGRVTAFVTGAGTGGTISGVGRSLT